MDLKKYLKRHSKTQVDFYRFNGNYGDSLIWHGTKRLLDDLNIKTNYVDLNSKIKNNTLLIDGGGNFTDYYSDVRVFLETKHRKYKRIIILPHTINGKKQKNILSQLKNNCTIFCREEKSYEFVKKYFTGKLYLWHDCAFYNNLTIYEKPGKGILNVFRQDCESAQTKTPRKNIDISINGWCQKPLNDFLKKISAHEEIRTDRLHVAIASMLLNKKTILYPNSYYKNLAVYNYSLSSYSNITFIYTEDKKLITQKNISSTLLTNKQAKQHQLNILNLFSQIKEKNLKLWKLEDIARDKKSNFKEISRAKKEIDKTNQQRNDTISKIDINLSFLLENKENSIDHFISESPGVLIDKLSIFYIKKNELKKILTIITDNDNLFKIYKRKLSTINKQINYLELYLEQLIKNIKNHKVFFKIFEPIKIYNDPGMRRYIDELNNTEPIPTSDNK